MSVPDFIARAIEAQGKTTVEEVLAVLQDTNYDEEEPVTEPPQQVSLLERNWRARHVTHEEVLGAHEHMERVTRESGLSDPGGRHFTPKTDHLWVGFLFENTVEAWLRDRNVAWTRHGGVRDGLPDFEVAGHGLGVKCASMEGCLVAPEYSGEPGRAITFLWPMKQPVPEYAAFGYFDPRLMDIYICGVVYRDAIESAPALLRGQIAYAKQPAGTDFYRVPESALADPELWLEEL